MRVSGSLSSRSQRSSKKKARQRRAKRLEVVSVCRRESSHAVRDAEEHRHNRRSHYARAGGKLHSSVSPVAIHPPGSALTVDVSTARPQSSEPSVSRGSTEPEPAGSNPMRVYVASFSRVSAMSRLRIVNWPIRSAGEKTESAFSIVSRSGL
jgi:hypothetical protein